MSGKKVFTHAGELLANFFSTKRKIDIKANKQEEILNYIGKTENLTGVEVDIKEFEKQYELTKTQALTEIDNSIHKRFSNYKITDGVKEIPVNEMVQRLYHELKNLDATTQAQFQAVTGFMSIKMAEQIKNAQEQYRQFSYNISKGNDSIANLTKKSLDYFAGGEADLNRVYYRFFGNRLSVANGIKNNQQWIEVFRINTATVDGQAQAGTEFRIGGASGEHIQTISLNKPTNVNGDLKVSNGEIHGIVTTARFADLAEYYTCNQKLPAGTLVGMNTEESKYDSSTYNELDPDQVSEIKKYNKWTEFIGVVSDKPGFVLNQTSKEEGYQSKEGLYNLPIVLTGRSPIKLVNKGRRGDAIFVPIKSVGNNLEEKEFLEGKALCFSQGQYQEYLKYNEPLRKIGVLLYDSVQDETIITEEYGQRDSYIGLAKIN